MNNNFQKALCISAICIFSGFNASYANTEIQDEYSTEHFYNLLTPNLVFPEKKAPFAVQNKLNILKTIAKKYPNDKNIQKLYHEHVGYFARENEYRYIALNELKESLKYLDQQDKLEVIRMHDQIARSYTEIWKFKEAEKEFAGMGYGNFKTAVGEAVVADLEPVQKRVKELEANKDYLDAIIKDGAEKAGRLANRTLTKVQKKVGFPARIR